MKKRNFKNGGVVLKSIIGTVIIGGIIVCLTTGCFPKVNLENEQNNVLATPTQNITKTYDVLTEDWNKAVYSLELGSKYEIEDRRDVIKLTEKLNNILNSTRSAKSFQKQQSCALNYDSKIYLPSKLYLEYLKKNELHKNVHFTKDSSEDEIISELKKVTNSKYIGKDMLRKIASLSSFEYYFNLNKKRFYKKGFSKHIKNFKTYQEALSRCILQK
jgi:hypothetical protein